MAKFDENRDLITIQVGELETQIRELIGIMQQRDSRIAELEAFATHQQSIAKEAAVVQQQNSVEGALRALQTPQIIRMLPPFDGNPIKLHSFIRSIDDLMPEISKVKNTPAYTVWLLAIRSKIIGDADNVLEFYGTSTDWDEIKNSLITHYSDKRDEVSLTKDLFKITQADKEIEDFYKEITFMLSLMVNQLNLNEHNSDVRAAKNLFYQEIGLKVFLAGLNEPVGTVIRAQCPTSLKDALRRCIEERNFYYHKQKSYTPPVPTRNKFQNKFSNPFSRFQQTPVTQNSFPSYPIQTNPFQRVAPIQRPQQLQHTPQQFSPFQPQVPFQRTFSPSQPNHSQRPQQPGPSNPFNRNPNQFSKPPSGTYRPPKPTPMEIDQSLRSLKVNYMNRPNFHEVNWTEPIDYYGQYSEPSNCYQYDATNYEQVNINNSSEEQPVTEPEGDTLNFQMELPETLET